MLSSYKLYKTISYVIILLVLAYSSSILAADKKEENVRKAFSEVFGDLQPDAIGESVLPGVYEVLMGAQVLYISGDGRYAVQGDIIDLEKRANVTESTRSKQRQKIVKKIDPASLIVFKPEKTKHVVTVFTDIDCSYCQKLHREMQQYTDLGIEIRYAAFPRSGVNTRSYFKAVTVWCSDNQLESMTESKAGKTLPRKDCENPVQEHMALAEQFGVSGTPTLVFGDGRVVPGYVPAKRLLSMLEDKNGIAM